MAIARLSGVELSYEETGAGVPLVWSFNLHVAEFLNTKNGQTWQSIPVAVFYTKDLEYLYHYTEFPAIYHKDRLVSGHIRAPRPGETNDETQARANSEFMALQQSPFFRLWASAAVDENISALHRRLVVGAH